MTVWQKCHIVIQNNNFFLGKVSWVYNYTQASDWGGLKFSISIPLWFLSNRYRFYYKKMQLL